MEESIEQAVRRLAATEDIRQLKARYFRAVDLKLWGMFADLFTEDLEIDFAESTSKPMTREQFVESARRHFEGAVPVHHGHVPEIEVIDDRHARDGHSVARIGGALPALVCAAARPGA